ncbi:GNAT family N-acetyltransferase [Rudaeicoccus suwonensis]|uniref:GNAT family N-acetyltransferase n=1 Tax=Rudaeicoccus suwonensis TaxID=657409 RepID=UPI0011A1F39F|nr:GNAT family N-acetyltransferase [Rudaeicoccus suwonensis]
MRTARLSLDRPRHSDLAELFAIYSDPRVWTHYPSHRHTEPATTEVMLQRWIDGWANDGFGMWIVRTLDDSAMLGHCGCTVRAGAFWNLGYSPGLCRSRAHPERTCGDPAMRSSSEAATGVDAVAE